MHCKDKRFRAVSQEDLLFMVFTGGVFSISRIPEAGAWRD